jgi:Flp pilus assembly protein TadD
VQKKQFILIGLCIVLLASFYFLGVRTTKSPVTSTTKAIPKDDHVSHDVEAIRFETLEKEGITSLPKDKQDLVQEITKKAITENNAIAFKDVAEFWEKEKELNLAANYYKKAAFLENTEKSITFAGNLFVAVMQKTTQPEIRKWQALEAIECFTKALSIQPDNVSSKIALATCYTEGTGETMKGVSLLREVTSTDSNNIAANIILGKLAIQSGQLEKAIRRLELVLSLRPENTEAMYFLAEAYKAQGDKVKAIQLFEQCKKLVGNPDFT